MEVKKTMRADLEGQRLTALLIGFVVSLAATYTALEWTTHEFKDLVKVAHFNPENNDNVELVPLTENVFANNKPLPAETPQVADILDIVDNALDVETSIKTSEDLNDVINAPSAQHGPVSMAPPAPTMDQGETDEVFELVENEPMFPGGDAALMKWLAKNLRYPAAAADAGIMGRVLVSFVVNRDGAIVEPKVVRSVHPALDKEAIRVVGAMPRWKPGKQGMKNVRVKFTLPITFRLQ